MTKQVIDIGTVANDGTGDTLRSAGTKINDNFTELYDKLGGNILGQISFEDSAIVFEGNAVNSFQTRMYVDEPTGNNKVYVPDFTGNFVLDSSTDTLKNKTLFQPYVDSATFDRLLIEDIDKSHKYNLVPGNLTGTRNIRLPNLADSDTITFNKHTQTLSNKTLFKPKVLQYIYDSIGEPMLEFSRQGTLSNLKIDNANNVNLDITSANTNASININSKNNGAVKIKNLALGSTSLITQGGTSGAHYQADDSVNLLKIDKSGDFYLDINDGNTVGELKLVANKSTSGADVLISFPSSTFANGTNITLAVDRACMLMWDGDQWYSLNRDSGYVIT